MIECPHRFECCDYLVKCSSCRKNNRRSYYEPVNPYAPYHGTPFKKDRFSRGETGKPTSRAVS